MNFKNMKAVALCVLMLALAAASAFADVHYVDADSTNATAPYTSWATASTTIQAAINAASSGDEVWVADGTYHEGISLTSVSVYGGFTGAETAKDQRNWHTNVGVSGYEGGSTEWWSVLGACQPNPDIPTPAECLRRFGISGLGPGCGECSGLAVQPSNPERPKVRRSGR